ncbi:MAG: GGDEF domain-containing response regulator, partial [Candidatus Angelobacter sp.]
KFDQHYSYFILLTSYTKKEQVIEGLSAGADDYLTKPFHPGELRARVRVGQRISDLHHQLLEKNRELREMALSDPLTGLPNRRALDAWTAHQISAAGRHKFSIWVALADLDHFKRINDVYGHDVGDIVLKGFAEVLKTNTRQSNICGRLGGEEFLTVITHIERKNVEVAINRIRKQFEAMKFTSSKDDFNVTASFGIAGLNGERPVSFHDLILQADTALYSAKDGGRNRLVFATQDGA